jgi:hypothetical protein
VQIPIFAQALIHAFDEAPKQRQASTAGHARTAYKDSLALFLSQNQIQRNFWAVFNESHNQISYTRLNSFHIADVFRRTVRSSGGGKSSRPTNQSIISRTSSPWLTGLP